MPQVQDTLTRASLYGELLREGAVLLAIFGPIATLEILRALPWKLALTIWSVAAVMLVTGVELEVRVRRQERDLKSLQLDVDPLSFS